MNKKLDQYRGKLTIEQIAEGMNLANRNAHRLHRDADSILSAGSYPTALALAALSIEESGKCAILRRFISTATDAGVRDLWKEYRSHTKKNVQWAIMDMIRQDGPTCLDDFKPLFAEDAEHPHLLDQLKQLGFYTDCLGNAHWSDPASVIDRDLALSIVQIAGVFCRAREVTVRELELWRDHMGSTNTAVRHPNAKEGLAAWYAAMQSEGLYPAGENAMAAFLQEGIKVGRTSSN